MSLIEALILGIIQGLTEFLPISSSGHLEMAKVLFGSDRLPEEGLLFTVLVHGATALATVVVFRKDVWGLISESLKPSGTEERKYISWILISMIPAVVVGLVWEDEIEALFTGQILLVGVMLLITGLMLFYADRAKHTDRTVDPFRAFFIGVAQAIAILPGISRSGATISASLLMGVDREKAARFSFLMVVPLILGKMTLDLKDVMDGEIHLNGQGLPLLVGFIAAFVAGYLACTWMIALVKRSKLTGFAIYCWVVGLIAIASYLL
jgi:undecaprenyl-diphosphatase